MAIPSCWWAILNTVSESGSTGSERSPTSLRRSHDGKAARCMPSCTPHSSAICWSRSPRRGRLPGQAVRRCSPKRVHSFVDIGNQILLLYGMRWAKLRADPDHPIGYRCELYFWSFIVALRVFALGAVVRFIGGLCMSKTRCRFMMLLSTMSCSQWLSCLRQHQGGWHSLQDD